MPTFPSAATRRKSRHTGRSRAAFINAFTTLPYRATIRACTRPYKESDSTRRLACADSRSGVTCVSAAYACVTSSSASL